MKSIFLTFGCLLACYLLPGQEFIDTTEEGELVIQRVESIKSNYKINRIYIDDGNMLWLASDHGVIKLSSFSGETEVLHGDKEFVDVVKDIKGNTWAATKTQVIGLEDGTVISIGSPEIQIRDIEYYKGRLWIATQNGLFTYNAVADNIQSFNTSNSKLKSNDINFVHADKHDLMWVGTTNGEIRIESDKVTEPDKWQIEDEKVNVRDVYEGVEGQWFVGVNDMWLINPFNRAFPVGLDSKMFRGEINDFVLDNKGRIYMASDILVRYDPYKEIIESYANDAALLSQKCLSLACDKNNNIYIGTNDGGLFRILFADVIADQLTAAILLENAIACNGVYNASFKVNAAGGNKPYKYKWSDGRLKGRNPVDIKPGSYTVTVSDKDDAQYITSIEIDEPAAITIAVVGQTRISAAGRKDGSAEVVASGGTGSFTYKWSHNKSGNTADKLAPGKYTVTATDEKGCTEVASVEIQKEKYLPNLDITQINVGQTLRINELFFQADSSILDEKNFEILDEVYDFLTSYSGVVIEIGGHTNTIPSHEYCDQLSEARAKNVAQYLYNRGIENNRISFKGYGKREPVARGESLAARKQNQRVEIKILALGD